MIDKVINHILGCPACITSVLIVLSVFVIAIIYIIKAIRVTSKKRTRTPYDDRYADFIKSHIFLFHTKFSMLGNKLNYTTKHCNELRIIKLSKPNNDGNIHCTFNPTSNIDIDITEYCDIDIDERGFNIVQLDFVICPDYFNVIDNLSIIMDIKDFRGLILYGCTNTYNKVNGFNIIGIANGQYKRLTSSYVRTKYVNEYYSFASMLSNNVNSTCDIGGVIVNCVTSYSCNKPYAKSELIPSNCNLRDILRIAVYMDMDNTEDSYRYDW